jgi:hypothetical protein
MRGKRTQEGVKNYRMFEQNIVLFVFCRMPMRSFFYFRLKARKHTHTHTNTQTNAETQTQIRTNLHTAYIHTVQL